MSRPIILKATLRNMINFNFLKLHLILNTTVLKHSCSRNYEQRKQDIFILSLMNKHLESYRTVLFNNYMFVQRLEHFLSINPI